MPVSDAGLDWAGRDRHVGPTFDEGAAYYITIHDCGYISELMLFTLLNLI